MYIGNTVKHIIYDIAGKKTNTRVGPQSRTVQLRR